MDEPRQGGSWPAPRRPTTYASGESLVQFRLDLAPVDQLIEEGGHVLGPTVLVVDVVGVLPNVDGEDRAHPVDQRILAIGSLHHFELVSLYREPSPTRPELSHARRLELLLERLERAERVVNPLGELATRIAAAALLHDPPEQIVVPVLAGIVENALLGSVPVGAGNDLLQRLAGELGALDQVVQVGDVGLMMLVMVQMQRFRRHVGRRRLIVVRQIRELESHVSLAFTGSGAQVSSWR